MERQERRIPRRRVQVEELMPQKRLGKVHKVAMFGGENGVPTEEIVGLPINKAKEGAENSL